MSGTEEPEYQFEEKITTQSPTNEEQSNEEQTNEEQTNEEQSELMRDIFGSDSEEEEGKPTKKYEEEEAKEYGDVKRIDIPKLPTPSADTELYFVRLPNVLSIESTPFDPELFKEEYETLHLKKTLHADNVIRWRQLSNGEKESNARIIKWSDGSMQLKVGHEYFDISQQDMSGEHVHLFARLNQHILGHGKFLYKWSLKPHSISSKSHKKLTIALAEKSERSRRTKLAPPDKDQLKQEKFIQHTPRKGKRKQIEPQLTLTKDALEQEDVSIKEIKHSYRKKRPKEDDIEGEQKIKKAKSSTPVVERRKKSQKEEEEPNESIPKEEEEEEFNLDDETDEEDEYKPSDHDDDDDDEKPKRKRR